jgi:hypothetical protein
MEAKNRGEVGNANADFDKLLEYDGSGMDESTSSIPASPAVTPATKKASAKKEKKVVRPLKFKIEKVKICFYYFDSQ